MPVYNGVYTYKDQNQKVDLANPNFVNVTKKMLNKLFAVENSIILSASEIILSIQFVAVKICKTGQRYLLKLLNDSCIMQRFLENSIDIIHIGPKILVIGDSVYLGVQLIDKQHYVVRLDDYIITHKVQIKSCNEIGAIGSSIFAISQKSTLLKLNQELQCVSETDFQVTKLISSDNQVIINNLPESDRIFKIELNTDGFEVREVDGYTQLESKTAGAFKCWRKGFAIWYQLAEGKIMPISIKQSAKEFLTNVGIGYFPELDPQ